MSIGLRGAEAASGIALSDELGLPQREKKWQKRAQERVRGESFEGKESASERNDVAKVDSRCIGQTESKGKKFSETKKKSVELLRQGKDNKNSHAGISWKTRCAIYVEKNRWI